MIPAKVRCPDASWTREYSGYLMTQSDSTRNSYHCTKFVCVDVCVDEEAEVIPIMAENVDGNLLYHVRVDTCGAEHLPCTYDLQKEITCVVCRK